MHRVLIMCLEAGIASIILIPGFWLLNRCWFHSPRQTAAYLAFSIYLAAVDAVAGLPSFLYIRIDPNINLVPFAYMFSDYRSSLLNVLLFVPFGIFLPVLWKRFHSFWATSLSALCFSLTIELLQLLTRRATDVNDLITNTFGSMLGWCVARLLLNLFPSLCPSRKTTDFLIVFGSTFWVMFALQPVLAECIWNLVKI